MELDPCRRKVGRCVSYANWYFSGFDTPAINVINDETVPTLNGAIRFPPSVNDAEATEIRQFYERNGLTANALRRATAADMIARVPVVTLAARTIAEIPRPAANPNNEPDPRAFRGTVSTVPLPLRGTTDVPIPAEPPAAP